MARIPLINERDADRARAAAGKVVEVHRRLAEFVRVGKTLAHVDSFVATTLEDLGCRSCFLGYRMPRSPAFPSHACLSLNSCIVHGTAGYTSQPLAPGDLLSIDIGVRYEGWIGDAAWTYAMQDRSDEAERLMSCGQASIRAGVAALQPGEKLVEWARAVQQCVEQEYGFFLTRGLGGHGYGTALHSPPYISNVVPNYPGEWPEANIRCEPGMLIAVEPMIAVGTGSSSSKPKEWPVFTADGSLSVHYEHDVLITPDGPEVLTKGLEALPDVLG